MLFCKKVVEERKHIMENAKKKINLEIAGSRIPLVTDENEEYVQKLAALVSQKVSAIALSGSGITKTDAALVYALTLLDENFKLRLELAEMKNSRNGN
jgi:cell division protein ZapA (FtsZ GTPase activity inhibitor)